MRSRVFLHFTLYDRFTYLDLRGEFECYSTFTLSSIEIYVQSQSVIKLVISVLCCQIGDLSIRDLSVLEYTYKAGKN